MIKIQHTSVNITVTILHYKLIQHYQSTFQSEHKIEHMRLSIRE